MPKCDACGIEVSSLCDCNTGELCNACAESWFWFRGSVFDWCVARHAELRGKQPATQPSPTDAELIAQAILSGSSLVALSALSYADAVGNEDESTKALRSMLKERGVIK